MADLPIQLSFFKKLEHYQFLTHRDKSVGLDLAWSGEKEILRWAATEHRHLGTAIDGDFVRDNILTNRSKYKSFPSDAERSMENLTRRGWADSDSSGGKLKIWFLRDGLLMGEVIDDVMAGGWRKWRYRFFYFLAWMTTLCGAFLIIAATAVYLLHFLHWLLQFICTHAF